MTRKIGIIDELGEEALLVPALIQHALAANDGIKYFISLLQTARLQAENPGMTLSSLRAERRAAGIDDESFDEVIPGAVRTGGGRYHVPHLDRILGGIGTMSEEMIPPLIVTGAPGALTFRARAASLVHRICRDEGQEIDGARIGAIASADRSVGDSFHLLVMDVHRALNELLQRLSNESIDGAAAYLLGPGDPELVRAFMSGVNRTAPLKFGHAGLGTTVVRAGERLQIQNDIGMTETHVLIATVIGTAVTVTYTDVHLSRVSFFQCLLEDWGVQWSDTLSRRAACGGTDAFYHLSVGNYQAADRQGCAAFLAYLGSRLVFLIDWNKARKRLGRFVSNQDALAVLGKATVDEVGHRGFLELGGDRLIYAALEAASGDRTPYGRPLHEVLGREGARDYLSWVLDASARGLLAGEPRPLVQDRCRIELLRRLRSRN